jgi:hypothetical protein
VEDGHGFTAGYLRVKGLVKELRGVTTPEAGKNRDSPIVWTRQIAAPSTTPGDSVATRLNANVL